MEVDAAPGEDAVAPSQGIRSRWLVDEEEEEAPQSLPNGKVHSPSNSCQLIQDAIPL